MRYSRGVWSRLSARDGLLALVLAAFGVLSSGYLGSWQPGARPVDALSGLLVVGAALSVTVRRVWPLGTLLAGATATCAYVLLGYPFGPILLSLAVAVYTAAARLPVWRAVGACAAVSVLVLAHLLAAAVAAPDPAALVGLAQGAAWMAVPFAAGRVVRIGRDNAARNRAAEIQRYTDEERLRIAQDVHDVVGNGLAAINLQAEIALHVLPKRPEQAESALTAISRTSKEALDELRATLTVLRRDPTTHGPGPGPGLARLDDLVARMRRAGLVVSVAVTGVSPAVSAAVDLAAYRIVQEALTNVLRHADAASAAVRVEYEPGRLTVEVTDPGPQSASGGPGGGHGLAGMRERVAALGGDFAAGPRGGGFRVRARLPLPGVPR